MGKYIDAERLKAEIKRYKNKADERLKIQGRTYAEELKDLALQNLCGNLLHFISSLQQEQPEVDLDDDFVFDEIMSVYDSNDCLPPRNGESLEMLEKVFHHAFNIGYNTNK